MPTPSPAPVGQRFGRLVVNHEAARRGKHRLMSCVCDCGSVKDFYLTNIKAGTTQSCGCFHAEVASKVNAVHGCSRKSGRTPEYRAWVKMRERCLNPSDNAYKNYGGRGITVCERWLNSFSDFLADVGRKPSPHHSIGREDNEGNYEPGNVRWETKDQQSTNRRNNVFVEFRGKRQTISQWADEIGMSQDTLWARIRVHGWDTHRALTTPVRIW